MIIIRFDNKNRLSLFWKVGKKVFENQNEDDNVLQRYSVFYQYKYGFSEMFCTRNVYFMKLFYSYFPIYFDKMSVLNWSHYVLLIKISNNKKRNFYFNLSLFTLIDEFELKYFVSNNFYEQLMIQ